MLDSKSTHLLQKVHACCYRASHRSAVHVFPLCFIYCMSFVVMGVHCTSAYANAPSPTHSTYVRIDDAYADWNRSRHGKGVDSSLLLAGLKALQGCPEAGTLRKSISTRSPTTSISCTPRTSEASIEVRSTGRCCHLLRP
jgi:hypothetical protein